MMLPQGAGTHNRRAVKSLGADERLRLIRRSLAADEEIGG